MAALAYNPRALLHNLQMKALVLVPLAALFCGTGFAQSGPEQGAVWTAGGHSVAGGRGNTGIWDAGLRFGWVLTKPVGPGFLKGRFEYAVDAVPAYLIFQPANTAYGVGFNPLNLKWNFAARSHVVPYAELSGGVLFTTHNVPSGTSTTNFRPSGAFGVQFPRQRWAWTLEGRYLHISNAGLERSNPGINTFEVRLGIGKFRKK